MDFSFSQAYHGPMVRYLPRIVDPEIEHSLTIAGAVEVRGPRAVGKTESARRLAASELRLDSSDPRAALARAQPATALEGSTPRLLDEWQLVPQLWNEVRHAVDDRREPGQFLLSGSAIPDDDALRHPGAGRVRRTQMRTMTLAESGESTGAVSLRALLAGDGAPMAESESTFLDVIARIVSGGWPGWIGVSDDAALARARDYMNDISEHDFAQVAGSRRDPRRFLALARALAALVAQPATYAAMTKRVAEDASVSVGVATVPILHGLAERIFIIEDQPAWSPRLRSRTAAQQTPKRHLADPSLAAALLGASTDRLLADPETLGFLFESQVVHDLRVYAQSAGARGVFHYRDAKGRDEIDVIVEAADGEWLAIEVKLGQGSVDAASTNLIRIGDKFVKPPRERIVVVPTGIAHRRTDGTLIVPLTVLGA